jgi:hypothetical protein
MTKKKDDFVLDEMAQAQHDRFVAGLGQPESVEDQLRRQVRSLVDPTTAGNTVFAGMDTFGELEVIKAADVAKDSANEKGKES